MKKYGLVILAAGGSVRLGSPKQLLQYQQQSLLKNIVDTSLKISNAHVVVVVGAQKDIMLKELNNHVVNIVVNENWLKGMSTSIKIGLAESIALNPLIEACIFVVCDQPFISLQLLQTLISTYEHTEKGIIACVYKGVTGTPVLFNKKYFNDFKLLENEEGAKKLLAINNNDLEIIPFIHGEIDIDTKEDYKKLIDAFRQI